MKMIDLFTGIGAWSYAGHILGIETVGFCEYEPECKKVLKKHWPKICFEILKVIANNKER